jgi:multiple sugar transport system ATP-binding protein
MTVAQNMAFGLEMRGLPKAERDVAVADAARLLQIEPLLARKPGQLSGGQRQRVAMGRALVRQPRIFLFDEPLSNLDAKLRVEMRTEIKKLHQRLGATIVYVTHDQIEAMTLATRIAIMNKGVLQQLGTPRELYDRPANTFVATFIGSPAMNLIPGAVCGSKVHLEGGIELPLMAPAPDGPTLLGLRPESITEAADGATGIELAVEVTEPTGPDTLAVVRIAGTEATARLRADTDVVPGRSAAFTLDMSKASLFHPRTGARLD